MFIPPTSYQEDRFYSFWQRHNIPYELTRQLQIGPYYADFAHPESRTIIEIDGAAWHSTPEQIARDQYRQSLLESWGWHVIRFTGKEIQHHPVHSIYAARRAIENNLNGLSAFETA